MAERLPTPICEVSGLLPSDVPSGPRVIGALSISGYDSLHIPPSISNAVDDALASQPNTTYDRYLRMHKVLVGRKGAYELEDIHHTLKNEALPQYIAAAGSAAIEAALALSEDDVTERLTLLDEGALCLIKAIDIQQQINEQEIPDLTEYAYPHRLALDVAVLPLLRDTVVGDVHPETCEAVFQDCLNLAQSNAVRIKLAKKEGNIQALGEHVGFGYECNALLFFNRNKSQTWFAIPSMGRCDTGYYHRHQTHDLVIMHQKWGKILSLTPLEIKASANRRDRERYHALLVRGKMHLSVDGRYRPEQMLETITKSHEYAASGTDTDIVQGISQRLIDMVRNYYNADNASERTPTFFRREALS